MTSTQGSLTTNHISRVAEQPALPDTSPTILIVDDEPFIVDLLALALQDEGYQVARAYDGEEAWRLLCAHRPDLIISDVTMPRLDGLHLLHRLRRQRVLAQIPVILMSAARRRIDAGDAAFVAKPFDLDRMLSLVHAKLPAA